MFYGWNRPIDDTDSQLEMSQFIQAACAPRVQRRVDAGDDADGGVAEGASRGLLERELETYRAGDAVAGEEDGVFRGPVFEAFGESPGGPANFTGLLIWWELLKWVVRACFYRGGVHDGMVCE